MKNAANIETVDKNRHGKLRVKRNPDFVHAKDLNLVSVVLGELGACACNFPVVLIQNPDNKQYYPVAMLGLRPGENVYYGQDGWDCTYAPLSVQRHPFMIGYDDRSDDDRQLATCILRNSPMLTDDVSDSIAIFTDSGEDTEFLQSRHLMLRDIFESERVTAQFVEKLEKFGLLAPLEIIMQPAQGEPRKVTGMFSISQSKLRALSKEQWMELQEQEFLAACHLMLSSVFQIHRLMQLRNKKSDDKVVDYRIDFDPQPAKAS